MHNIPITYDGIDQVCDKVIEIATEDNNMGYIQFFSFQKHVEYLRKYAKEDLNTGNLCGYQVVCSLMLR